MENIKVLAFKNKINELVGKELNFQNNKLNELSVENILILAEESALEWQNIIKTENLDQNLAEVQSITSFFLQAFHLRNLYVDAKSYFLNVTLAHISSKEEDLKFKLLTDDELEELSQELLNKKQNILESIDLLANERIADSLCMNYNLINLHTKLENLRT